MKAVSFLEMFTLLELNFIYRLKTSGIWDVQYRLCCSFCFGCFNSCSRRVQHKMK